MKDLIQSLVETLTGTKDATIADLRAQLAGTEREARDMEHELREMKKLHARAALLGKQARETLETERMEARTVKRDALTQRVYAGQLFTTLLAVQWSPAGPGVNFCPSCGRRRDAGHDSACALGAKRAPTEAISIVRALLVLRDMLAPRCFVDSCGVLAARLVSATGLLVCEAHRHPSKADRELPWADALRG